MAVNYDFSRPGEVLEQLFDEIDNLGPATQLKDGLMTKEDVTKLSGIQPGAQVNPTVDQTPTEGSNNPVSSGGVAAAIAGFITRAVTDLVNYYTKSQTYTKTEVNNLLGALHQFHFEIYATLPATGDGSVLYLIGPTGTGSDKYEEYVWANNDWTKIGDTTIDLSGYVTTEALNAALANYTTSEALTELLANKANTSDLEDGTVVPKLATDLESWSNGAAPVKDKMTDTVRTTAGEVSVVSDKGATLLSIVPTKRFYATSMRFTGKNLLRDAVSVGAGYYFLIPALPFGTPGTAVTPNGLLFVDSSGNNLKPTVRFKAIAEGVPASVNDGVACPYTDATYEGASLRFYNPAGIGYIIVSGITLASTCARVAWSGNGFPYNRFVSPSDAADAGFTIALAATIHAVHDYDYLLVAGNKRDYIEYISRTQVRWHRVLERVKPTWATTENEDGSYTHTATISGMASGGVAETWDNDIELAVLGTTISYTDSEASATAQYIVYELATEGTGTVNLETHGPIEDFGLEEIVGAVGEAVVTIEYSRGYKDSLRALVDGELYERFNDVQEQVNAIEEDVENLLLGSDDLMAAAWGEDQSSPVAVAKHGNDKLVNFDFFLLDHTRNTAPTSKPIGKLRRNNLLRFDDGSFAPVVGITQAMYDECMANDLYLDGSLYAASGNFNPEAFYRDHCSVQLVDGVYRIVTATLKKGSASGDEVAHYLMPWETTSTDYGIYIGSEHSLYYLQNVRGNSGKKWNFISATPKSWDGATTVKIAPFGISPGLPTVIVDGSTRKTRPFFFAYDGAAAVYANGADGITNQCSMFKNTGRMMPAANVMSQQTTKGYARNNNSDADSPVPFAEGGWHQLNLFLSYLEIKYGTRYLHAASFFTSGISSNDSVSNETNWLNYGGVRCKKTSESTWAYQRFDQTSAALRTTAAGGTQNWNNFINSYYPKEACMESQLAASFAVEMGIPADTEYAMYGNTYKWSAVPNAESISDGRMNAIIRSIRKQTVSAYDTSGNAESFDVEVNLRMPLYEGLSCTGDIYWYFGGGLEMIGTCISSVSGHTGDPVDFFSEPDQSKWVDDDDVTHNDGSAFLAESTYTKIGTEKVLGNGYSLRDLPMTPWKTKMGGGIGSGMSHYAYDSVSWSTTVGARVRLGVRFRGYAIRTLCSTRSLYAPAAASYTDRAYGGSAQVALPESAAPLQAE